MTKQRNNCVFRWLSGAVFLLAISPHPADAQIQVDIKSYGARCDGSNDAGAVQAAINAIPTSGGTVLVSCQAGIGSNGIVLSGKGNVTVAGTGGGGFRALAPTGQSAQGFGPVMFLIQSCSNCTIRDLIIDGRNVGVAPLGFDRCSGSKAQNNSISNVAYPANAGIVAVGNQGNSYTGNSITHTGLISTDGTRGMWIGNTGDSQTDWNPTISNNTLSDIGATAIVGHTVGAMISNNQVDGTKGAGVKIVPPLGKGGVTTIQGNTLRGNLFHGIQIENADSASVIQNNVIDNNAVSGVYASGGAYSNAQIKNNTITNHKEAAIYLYNGDGVTIQGNQIVGNGHGVIIEAVSGESIRNIQITSNTIKGENANGVTFWGRGGSLSSVAINTNSIYSNSQYGVFVEQLSGSISGVSASGNCFANNGSGTIYDNRGALSPAPSSGSCSDAGSTPSDTTAPSVSITSPGNGQTVSGTINVTASASDNVGVAGVQFTLDGSPLGAEVTSSPYTRSWNTVGASAGSHTLTATARDAAGNTRTASVSVNIAGTASDTTLPTVSITSPTSGQTIAGTVNLTASASDNVGVAGVQFLIDGMAYGGEDTSAPFASSWSSATVANGTHTVSAIARDAAGNKRTSAAISVTTSNASTSNASTTSGPKTATVRINAGGSAYTDPSGNVWAADSGSNGGYTYAPGRTVTNTTTPELYQSQRWWDQQPLTYTFAVANGTYNVKLKFAELYFSSAGQRVFSIAINGTTVASNFDIVAQAGGPLRAVDKTFPVSATGGKISIRMTASVDAPAINAIEIVKPTTTTPPKATIRVNAGGSAYTDPTGTVWSADTGSAGGFNYASTAAIANTTTPALYQNLRWNVGNLGYQFTVPNATYTVKLKFAELYYSSSGQRVFNVAINGQTVLTNFDIVAQAGGANHAVDKSFTVNVTNGQISIQMNSTVDDPQVNAIEIF